MKERKEKGDPCRMCIRVHLIRRDWRLRKKKTSTKASLHSTNSEILSFSSSPTTKTNNSFLEEKTPMPSGKLNPLNYQKVDFSHSTIPTVWDILLPESICNNMDPSSVYNMTTNLISMNLRSRRHCYPQRSSRYSWTS